MPTWTRPTASRARFVQFAAIPAEARYRFILENAEVMVGGITYGPVCNGQTATYAVKDQFWVFFLDPATTHRCRSRCSASTVRRR
jgi:hypothetical protein